MNFPLTPSTESVLCAAAGGSSEYTQRVVGQVASLGFPCYVTALEQVMALEPQPPLLVPQVGQTSLVAQCLGVV